MNKLSKKSLYPVLLFLFLFIFQAFLYNDDACSLSSQVCFQDFTFIELIYKPDIQEIPQTPSDSSFNNHDDYPSIFSLDNLDNSKFKFLQSNTSLYSNEIINRHLAFPNSNTISIIQKKNHWHQSSDDEPSPRIYS